MQRWCWTFSGNGTWSGGRGDPVRGRLAPPVARLGVAHWLARLRVRTDAPLPPWSRHRPFEALEPSAEARPRSLILLLVGLGPERRPALCHPPDPELGPDGQPHWLKRRGAEFPCRLTFRGMASAESPRVLGKNRAASGFSLPRCSRSGDAPRRPDTKPMILSAFRCTMPNRTVSPGMGIRK